MKGHSFREGILSLLLNVLEWWEDKQVQMSPGHLERENGTKVLLGLKQRLASLSDTRDHSSCEWVRSPRKKMQRKEKKKKRAASWSIPVVQGGKRQGVRQSSKEFRRLCAAMLKSKASFSCSVSLRRCLWQLLCKTVHIINKSPWAATEKQQICFQCFWDCLALPASGLGIFLVQTGDHHWLATASSAWLLPLHTDFSSSLLQTWAGRWHPPLSAKAAHLKSSYGTTFFYLPIVFKILEGKFGLYNFYPALSFLLVFFFNFLVAFVLLAKPVSQQTPLGIRVGPLL